VKPRPAAAPPRIFLLSPASSHGERAQLVFRPEAEFPLARALRAPEGAPLGEVFTFLSGLYFRGKLGYARAFARPPAGVPGVVVITTSEGLVSPESPVTLDRLRRWAAVPIEFTMAPPDTVQADPTLRTTLLDYYIANATAVELAGWLKGIGQDTSGSPAEKAARLREHTKYLNMTAGEFPDQTIYLL